MELQSALFTTQINNCNNGSNNYSCNGSAVAKANVNNTQVMFYNNRFPNVRVRNKNELQRIFPYHLFNKFTSTLTDENINSKLNIHHYVNSSENYIDEHQLLLERLSHKYKSQFHYGKHFFEKFAIIAKNNTKLLTQHKHAISSINNTNTVNNNNNTVNNNNTGSNKGKRKQGRFFNMIINLVNNKSKRNKCRNSYIQCNSNSNTINVNSTSNNNNNKQRVIKIPQLNINRNVNCDNRNTSVQKKRMSSLPLNTISDGLSARYNNDKQMEYFNLRSSNYLSRNKKGSIFDNKGSNYILSNNSNKMNIKDKQIIYNTTKHYNEINHPKKSNSSNNKCRNWKRSMLSLQVGDSVVSSFSPLSSI